MKDIGLFVIFAILLSVLAIAKIATHTNYKKGYRENAAFLWRFHIATGIIWISIFCTAAIFGQLTDTRNELNMQNLSRLIWAIPTIIVMIAWALSAIALAPPDNSEGS